MTLTKSDILGYVRKIKMDVDSFTNLGDIDRNYAQVHEIIEEASGALTALIEDIEEEINR